MYRKLRVIVFSTGTEVVEIGNEPAFGQIFDSNRHVLMTSLNELGYCEGPSIYSQNQLLH